jgi:hypothetical protein
MKSGRPPIHGAAMTRTELQRRWRAGWKDRVDQKLDAIIEHLTQVIDGGYPGEHIWVGDTMAYTSANTGDKYGSQLRVITAAEMVAWYDRATAFLRDNPDHDMSSALYETARE